MKSNDGTKAETGIDTTDKTKTSRSTDFIRSIIKEEIDKNTHGGKVHTRFPPEPNGYLHIGHAKSICLNFGIANDFPGGKCNLRFDDTNPSKEEQEYIDSIIEDVRWLGFDWEERMYFASDNFEQLYLYAEQLIQTGLAYVCDLSPDEIREYRGTLTEPGKNSPYRDRPMEENLDLFRRMRAGDFPDGSRVLRAKIDMASSNINMRDPIIYRILRATHHRTGDTWCIYPMYDYAHPICDSLEGITYSICTLEFEDHRPLYDWFLQKLDIFPSRQIEFARLNLGYTVMSKRKLLELVKRGIVSGWDDPRMPTIAGLRKRGVTPKAIRAFCERIGVAKKDSMVEMGLFEHHIREDLHVCAPRVMAVLRPIKIVIENYPEDASEEFTLPYHPDNQEMGSRAVPFSREIFIEEDDFQEEPAKKFFRLAPGREVRLRGAYFITCTGVIKDPNSGEIKEIRCTYDPATKGGDAPDGRKVKGTLHWVSAAHALPAEIKLYERLFTEENPFAQADKNGRDVMDYLNAESLITLQDCLVEPSLKEAELSSRYQFERQGYFCLDSKNADGDKFIFNRIITLKDSWAKIEKKAPQAAQPQKPKEKTAKEEIKTEISIEDFQKLDLRSGLVLEAHAVEGADKLLRLLVDIGEPKPRQVFAGIKSAYPDPAALIGKRVIVLANLKARQMKFGLSEGMILAGGDKKSLSVCTFDGDPQPGDKVS